MGATVHFSANKWLFPMNIFYVYEHWRTDKDECFYVGKGKGKRAYNMSSRNFYHKSIQKKLFRSGFAVEIKIVASGLSENDAFTLECERILFWKTNNVNLANLSFGGEGKTGKHSEEHKTKISLALKGKKKQQSVINAIIASNKKRKGAKLPKRTEKHKEMLSKSLVGRFGAGSKKVICLNDSVTYNSAAEATAFYGLKSVSCISLVCTGKRKTAAGRVFKYLEEA